MYTRYFLSLLFASSLSLGACVPAVWSKPSQNGSLSVPSNSYVCLDLPTKQLPAARAAVEGWDHALKQWKHFIAVDGNAGNCTYWVHEVTHDYAEDDHALAWASMLGGHEISMRKGWYEHDTTGILLHELGHALGAQHVPGTLMNEQYLRHGFICPDATTVAQVAAWNKVSLELLCWCY